MNQTQTQGRRLRVLLRGLGVSTVLGGEFEEQLVQLSKQVITSAGSADAGPRRQSLPLISLARQLKPLL